MLRLRSRERAIAIAYGSWNIVILGVLYYRINIHKRNHFAKEIQLEGIISTDHLTKIPTEKHVTTRSKQPVKQMKLPHVS